MSKRDEKNAELYRDGHGAGMDYALNAVINRAATYFPVDAASQRMVANLVNKVREEHRMNETPGGES